MESSMDRSAESVNTNLDVENRPKYTYNASEGPPEYPAGGDYQDPPPSYDSLFGRVKKMKSESSGTMDFFKTLVTVLLSTIGFTILVGVFLAIPISMIVMGAVYLDDCPAERMIPIYLIVAGSFGCAKNLFSLIQRCRKSREEREEETTKVNPLTSLVDCFLFAWFIAGCVYIYRTKDEFQAHDPSGSDYCDYTLYWYSFWITTSVYIIMGASCLCICCIGCIAAVCK